MHDWDAWLEEWNRRLLAALAAGGRDAFTDPRVTPSVIAGGWLGAPGAAEVEVAGLEERLGVRLPPSYRAFLRASNGFLQPGMIVPRLLPAEEVRWLRDVDPDTIAIWTEGLDQLGAAAPDDAFEQYLPTALQVSATELVGSAMYLLNPRVVGPDGEWEAFYFAHWIPGADRFPSFRALMERERAMLEARDVPPQAGGSGPSRRAPSPGFMDLIKWIFRLPPP